MLILLTIRSLRLNTRKKKAGGIPYCLGNFKENSPLSQARAWLNGSTLGKNSRALRLIQQLVSTKVGIRHLYVYYLFS